MINKPISSSLKDVCPSSAIVQVEQVSLAASIGSAYLLQDISFEVNRGDRLVIICPSGAGKTSLLRLLNRLSTPTTGSIELEDRSIDEIPVIDLHRQVVLVPQEAKLLGAPVTLIFICDLRYC